MTSRDRRQLELLSTFHYAYAALLGLSAVYMLVLVFAGVAELAQPSSSDSGEAGLAGAMGKAVLAMGVVGFAVASVLMGATVAAARRLRRGTHRTYCMVVAVVNSLSVPLGTVLGIVTLVVLMRPSVADWFARGGNGGDEGLGRSEGFEAPGSSAL